MRTIVRRYVCAALLAALCVAASGPPAGAMDPYLLYAIEPLTGGGSLFGNAQHAGLEALEDYVNKTGGIGGQPVKFVVEDNQSSPQIAVQLTNVLIGKGVPVILGAADVASCKAMFPLAKNGPLIYCLSTSAAPAPGTFEFATGADTRDMIAVSIRYFRMRGLKRIAEISATDASGQTFDEGIDAALALPENQDVKLPDREHFGLTDLSVQGQLARIKATNPDLLIVGTSGNAIGTVLHGIVNVGINVPVLLSNGAATFAMMGQYADILPKDLYFFAVPCLAPNEITDRATKEALVPFFSALAARGIKADGLESVGWDPAYIVISALRKLGTGATSAQLRAYIANLHGWVGANGPYDFRRHPQRGLGQEDALVVRWEPAKEGWIGVSKLGGVPLKSR